MFDRQGFAAFVGGNVGATYAAGLASIERIYGVDIDREVEKDKCSHTLSLIEADKQTRSGNERHDRQNWMAHLRKYLVYIGLSPEGRQKQTFIAWMKTQPQRSNPTKKYAEATVNGAANLLESGLQKLGVAGYETVNCFTITDAKKFKDLHTACYDAATAFDKKAGVADFRNGLDFYLQYLTGVGSVSYNTLQKIRFIIQHYVDNFAEVNKQERYKWEAQHWYKQHWDINAANFAEMLKEAFSKEGNLLDSGRNSLAYTMLCKFAEEDPERVRSAFSLLYDEATPLEDRVTSFTAEFEKWAKEMKDRDPSRSKKLNDYQDLHAVSVYLSFEYPEKYFIYKASCYNTFTERVNFKGTSTAKNFSIKTIENLEQLCRIIINEAKGNASLMALHPARLDENCYQDEELHFLAQDLVFYGGKTMSTEIFDEILVATEDEEETMDTGTKIGLNTILYGPPGTGKTYHTVIYAVAIIEKDKTLEAIQAEAKTSYQAVLDRYNEYKEQDLIAFTTFHQSYGYEEFIEGIKPVEDAGDITYQVKPGVFKKFCEEMADEKKPFDDAWDALIEKIIENNNEYDFTRRAGSVVHVELRDDESFIITWSTGKTDTIKKARVYKQWATNRYAQKGKASGGTKWWIETYQAIIDELVKNYGLSEHNVCSEKKNKVFIIDEINRGNISKIFGELITLIEESKRVGKDEGMKTTLPYSMEPFGVPENVYILGTMNTADRSIATIDTALRRRFAFKEMLPDPEVLENILVDELSIQDLLTKMNQRIEVLYDREHTIGHAYFKSLEKDNRIAALADIFKNKVIPLLQEYFYEDYEKIRLVLGDNQKTDEKEQFIQKKQVKIGDLFGNAEVELGCDYTYVINDDAFMNLEAYKKIL